MHYVIVGNGISGMSAANELRQHDRSSKITIISREHEHLFARTALMYAFCGQLSMRDLEPYERDHYQKMNFERVSDEVLSVDFKSRSLVLKNSGSLNFDKLLIASGSVPRQAPFQKEGIQGLGHFVTLNDLKWLEGAANSAKRAAVVGGGLIGVEVAEILTLAGIQVDFLIREEWYFPIALNKAESSYVAEHMRQHKCNVLLETEIEEVLTKDNAVSGVKLNNGKTLELDFIAICIGVMPATDFLNSDQIELNKQSKGIEVNEYQATSVKDVFAAGDCASVEWFDGERRPEQLWYTARDQGVIAAKNMLGERISYERGTFYNSAKFFDLEYTTAGLVNWPLSGLSEWYQKHPALPVSQRIVVQDGKVVGFNMLGSRWDHQIFMQWIEEKKTLEWALSNLEQARFDAEFSPKFEIFPEAATYEL